MSEVKQLRITGAAATSYSKPPKGTRKKKLGGGDPNDPAGNIPPGPQITSTKNVANAGKLMQTANQLFGNSPETTGTTSKLSLPLTPATVAASAARTLPPLPSMSGGKGNVSAIVPVAPHQKPTPPVPALAPVGGASKPKAKLILAPAKKQTKKLVLAPPASSSQKMKRPFKGIKHTRKIRVQLGGFKKRLTRAKTISKDSREKSIQEIRRILEEAKLIQPLKAGKTTPTHAKYETMLRTIYKDYMILRNRAL
jgi:hypothetical protein